MTRLLFPTVFIFLLSVSACKKKQATPLDDDEPCAGYTTIVNDSLTALITMANNGQNAKIIRIQNGIDSVVLEDVNYDFWGVSISPDKSKFICFRSSAANTEKVDDFATAELWLYNFDGSNGHMITNRALQGLNGMGMAKWAPDGLHIVYAGEKMETDGHLHWNIYLTDTTGSAGIKMNTRLGSFKYPAFANGDMTKLSYQAWVSGVTLSGGVLDTELFFANVNGSYQITSEQQLTNNGYVEYSPSFSPDNLNVVYAQTTSTETMSAVTLCTADIAGGTTNTMLSNNNINENPIWCTTNNRVYYINLTNSICLRHFNSIAPSGGTTQVCYRKHNSQFYQGDIK